MKLKYLLQHFLVAGSLLAATDAAMASVTSTIDAGIRGTQQGRLSRNGSAQDWTGGEVYPGIFNPTVTYFYSTYAVNVGSSNYLEITLDSTSRNTFLSAYQTSYDSNSLSTNWLGDDGTSGNFFGTDTLYFQIVAAMNSTVIFVVSNTAAGGVGIGDPFTLSVYSYPDSSYNTALVELDPRRVPEPSTLLLLLAPLGLVAGCKLGARRSKTAALAAA